MGIKPDAWMPLYVADYRADTVRLSTEQHGAYLLILMDYWRNGPPPDDDKVLAQITGLSLARWKAHRPVIQGFFAVDGVWRQKRADKEMDRAVKLQETLSGRGKKGADARWSKDSPSNATAMQQAMQQAMPGTMLADAPSPSPTPSTTTKSKTLSANADGVFQKFWQAYPRKTAKKKASDIFKRLRVDDALLASMLTALRAQGGTDQWKRGIIPHAATWLNQRRWEDEVTPVNVRTVDTSCSETTAGDRCGMPGTVRGGDVYRCDHHERLRQERSNAPMPDSAKKALAEFKRRPMA